MDTLIIKIEKCKLKITHTRNTESFTNCTLYQGIFISVNKGSLKVKLDIG